jgi:hypothetical protein
LALFSAIEYLADHKVTTSVKFLLITVLLIKYSVYWGLAGMALFLLLCSIFMVIYHMVIILLCQGDVRSADCPDLTVAAEARSDWFGVFCGLI